MRHTWSPNLITRQVGLRLVQTGMVEPCPEDYQSERWNSPIFLVSKKGGSHHFIADLWGVNEKLLDDNYPLNNINHMLDEINGDMIFSTSDFSQRFFQFHTIRTRGSTVPSLTKAEDISSAL